MSVDQTITVRPAIAADAALLSELIIAAFSAYPVSLNPPSSALQETPDAIRAKSADHGAGIAEIGGSAVGCVLFTPEDAATPSISDGSPSFRRGAAAASRGR